MLCSGCHVCGRPLVAIPRRGAQPRCSPSPWHTAASPARGPQHSTAPAAAALRRGKPGTPRQERGAGGRASSRDPGHLPCTPAAGDGEVAGQCVTTGHSPTSAESPVDGAGGGGFLSRGEGFISAVSSSEMGRVAIEGAPTPGGVTRRAAVAWGALAGSLCVSYGVLPPPSVATNTAAAAAAAGGGRQRRIAPALGAAITRSVYDAVIQQHVGCSLMYSTTFNTN